MISTKEGIAVPKTGTYISGRLYSAIKYKANLRNINFDLSLKFLDDLFESQAGLCYYSGLKIEGKARNQVTASLDRTNSNLGYIESNVHWVHKDVNFMKHTASEDHFFDLIELIHVKKKEDEKI